MQSEIGKMMQESSKSDGTIDLDARLISEVKAWLVSQFDAVGKDVPDFEYSAKTIAHLHNIVTRSESNTRAASIIMDDFHQKALEYSAQVARIREILAHVGLAQESIPTNVVSSAQALATVANLLNIKDTELSSFLVAIAELSLREIAVEERRAKAQQTSKELLDYTRKAISRLTNLKRMLLQLEDDIVPCEAQMDHWKKNLAIMELKERQYFQQLSNNKTILNHVGYSSAISHRMLVEMAENRKEVEKKTKPILDKLRSYKDLPPVLSRLDNTLAALAIENKKKQFAAAEKYLEDVLQSALDSTD